VSNTSGDVSNEPAKLIVEEPGLFHFAEGGAALHVLAEDTPTAWNNYFFNDQYYLELDQCGQGRALVSDDELRSLRGNYRYFYLKDEEEDNDVWSLTGRPLNVARDSFKTLHAVGHSEFHSSRGGIDSCVVAFVPTQGSHELWKVTLTNSSDRPRILSLFSAFPFEDETLMKARSWYDAKSGICYADYFTHHHDYAGHDRLKNRRTLNFLFSTRTPNSGASGERSFFGSDDFSRVPHAVKEGVCAGTASVMDTPMGGLHHRIVLEPGETVELGFCRGVEQDPPAVLRLRSSYDSPAAFDQELAKVASIGCERSQRLSIETPDQGLNGFINHWLPKQVTFQHQKNRLSGAFPIRNQLQDCMGYSLLEPALAVDFLMTRFPLQQADGSLRQWWSEGDRDDHSLCQMDFKDAGIWLILCSVIVADQSGSLDLMKQRVPFQDSDETATVFEHLMRAAKYLAANRGAHGLCLFGDGDWTDPINGPGRGGKGESTWTTCALGAAAKMLLGVANEIDEHQAATWLTELIDSLHQAVDKHCWNGSWLITGFDDEGNAFGNPTDQEARIFLNSQTWAIIAGFVSEERRPKVVEAIRSLETKSGTLVSWPPFSQWNPTWGRISLKEAGTAENGSVYCHASLFKAYADCCLGNGDAALQEILRVMPTNPDNPPSHNTQAPIFVPNYYFGLADSPEFGVSSRNHSTGTAPWMLWVIVEHVLGVRATPAGLEVKPNFPAAWPAAKLVRHFRGSRYEISFINSGHGNPLTIEVDGEPLKSTVLPCGNLNYQVSIVV